MLFKKLQSNVYNRAAVAEVDESILKEIETNLEQALNVRIGSILVGKSDMSVGVVDYRQGFISLQELMLQIQHILAGSDGRVISMDYSDAIHVSPDGAIKVVTPAEIAVNARIVTGIISIVIPMYGNIDVNINSGNGSFL